MEIRGARYIHVLVPCPLGWGSAPSDTIRLARLATETGLFPVFEAEHGEVTAVSGSAARPRSRSTCACRAAIGHLFEDGNAPGPTSSPPRRRWPTATSAATA